MIRVRQIRWTSSLVRLICRVKAGRALLRLFQSAPVTGPIYRAALGYQRPFPSLPEAKAAVAPYESKGHENPYNALLHLELGRTARPSDYAAMFHISRMTPRPQTVFDLGGNVGNLFYCYSTHLTWLSGVSWKVFDMPANTTMGAEWAKQRGASQLSFTNNWQDANGVDLLIVSGSLHYFEQPVPQMVGELSKKPRYILVNRTPLIDADPVATIQDAGQFRVACMLHNRKQLTEEFVALGYKLVDQWSAPELSMDVPGYPEYKVASYSGLLFAS
jgi:putative methyltransferase (TIGR04325 family)